MRGVVMGSDVLPTDASDEQIDAALVIMRAEVKALLRGEGEYAGARESVASGSLHSGYAVALVIANCIAKIRDAQTVRS
jgi:hypothetical protein